MQWKSCGGAALADLEVVGGDHGGILRTFRNRNPLGVGVQHVNRGAVYDVVGRVIVGVLLDGDAERCQQRLQHLVLRRSAYERRVESSDVRCDVRRAVAPRIDTDEDDSRRHDARCAARKLHAHVGQCLQCQRADVRAIREAEEQQCVLAMQFAKMQRLPLAVDERYIRQGARFGQQRCSL